MYANVGSMTNLEALESAVIIKIVSRNQGFDYNINNVSRGVTLLVA
jgi:hypothetical protein